MSDLPGKSRPMPAAPFDDPSIPVLTERLTLPDLDLDFTLPPADGGDAGAAAASPASAAAVPAAAPATTAPALDAATATSPRLLGSEFETDDWLVETIPLAPKPDFSLDLSTIDVPPLSVTPPPPPPLPPPPAPPATVTVPAPPPAAPPPTAPPPTVPAPVRPDLPITAAPLPADSGFAAADVVIPASLMRAPVGRESTPAANPAPTFDQLPPSPGEATVAPAAAAVAPESSATLAGGAFAVPPAPAAAAHWTTLELELRESILRELSQRLPEDVESILRRQLAPAIDAAVGAAVGAATAQLATEIRRAATASLRDLVDHAVQTELARLREQRQR